MGGIEDLYGVVVDPLATAAGNTFREGFEQAYSEEEDQGTLYISRWAYASKSKAESEIRQIIKSRLDESVPAEEYPTQDQMDRIGAWIVTDLITEDCKPSGAYASEYTMETYYANGAHGVHDPFYGKDDGDLDGRTRYLYEGAADAGGGGGGPASLPVDFRYSPFVNPSLLTERFEVAPVMNAGFLPAFRPGDLDEYITPHPDRYATIRVMSIDKEVIYATTNFMMHGYNKATKEDFKIIESTLGNTLQLNKEKFKLFKMRLGLVDAEMPFDWLRNWEDKWEDYMRASVLAQNRWRWYILFGSHLIGGYPLQYSLGANAKDEPYSVIDVDVFVTDDVRLPDMKRMTTEEGLTYFRWGGTVYNPDTLQFERTIPEYPTSPRKADSPEDASYESES